MSDNPLKRREPKAIIVILSAAAVVLCVAAGVWIAPRVRLAFNASQFRDNGDANAFLYVYESLRNGDTIERIEGLLGSGQPNQDPKYRAACKKVVDANPDEAPSGFLESDALMGYSAGVNIIHLQFRDGQLVNHTPTISPFMSGSLR